MLRRAGGTCGLSHKVMNKPHLPVHQQDPAGQRGIVDSRCELLDPVAEPRVRAPHEGAREAAPVANHAAHHV